MNKKPLDIALIRKNYTPYGGAENYLKLIAERLTLTGHHVCIFSSGNWPHTLAVSRIRGYNKPSFLSNIFFALASRAKLKKSSFDCILSFERTLFQDIYRAGDGCHKEWLKKRKAVDPVLKKISFCINPHHLILQYLEKKCFFNSKTIIANSIMVKKDIRKYYPVSEEKIRVIYNGVDLERFQPSNEVQKTAGKAACDILEEKVVLFVGADFKRKGLAVLLKAFSLLNRDNVKLVIAGRPPITRYISMAKNLGIDNKVVFRGAEKNMKELYSISDVFVLPTIYDPFSNATLEAMASGLPVVTTSCNGASELIENGVQGFVIDNPFDAALLAEKISAALEQSGHMGKQARCKAEDYPIEKAIDEITDAISEHGG